jgi:biotin carboxyl carrier protein
MDFRYQHHDQEYTVRLEPGSDGFYTATVGDKTYAVHILREQPGQLTLLINGRRFHTYTATEKTLVTGATRHYIALVDRQTSLFELTKVQAGGARRRSAGVGSGSLDAQMPGQVTQVLVAEGDPVQKGQTLLILEAMKMESRVVAPHDGKVARLLVQAGQTVERGQQLAEVQPYSPSA